MKPKKTVSSIKKTTFLILSRHKLCLCQGIELFAKESSRLVMSLSFHCDDCVKPKDQRGNLTWPYYIGGALLFFCFFFRCNCEKKSLMRKTVITTIESLEFMKLIHLRNESPRKHYLLKRRVTLLFHSKII